MARASLLMPEADRRGSPRLALPPGLARAQSTSVPHRFGQTPVLTLPDGSRRRGERRISGRSRLPRNSIGRHTPGAAQRAFPRATRVRSTVWRVDTDSDAGCLRGAVQMRWCRTPTHDTLLYIIILCQVRRTRRGRTPLSAVRLPASVRGRVHSPRMPRPGGRG